jgi:mannose PTS system EIID component
MNKGNGVEQNDQVLTKKDLWRAMRRHYLAISTYNYDSGFAATLVWELFPALSKIYKDDPDGLQESIDNQFKFYNCNPWVSPIITGATLAIEEKGKNKSLQAVQDLKAALMGPFSGIGDTLIWVLFPTVLGAIAASMGKHGSSIGMWIYATIYILFFFLRSFLYNVGYQSGTSLMTNMSDKLSALTDAVSVLGIAVIGAIVPSTVNFKLALKFSQSGVSLTGQQILDQLMPGLMPVLLTWLLYWMLKKGHKMTTLILMVIIIAMSGAGLGIFKA